MDPKPAIAIADVLEAQRLVWTDTTHNLGWVVPTPGGGAVVHAGSTDVHVGALDRLWVRDRADGRETHIDLPPGALPACAGHAVAAVSLDGEAAAWANLATVECHDVAERAPALEG